MRARPRHAEDQPASDRGETAPPSAPARARSVNTYARPSSHGNIRASRAEASHAARIGMLAPWAAADPVGRVARPRHTTRLAHNHPQRAAAHRAALPTRPAPQSLTNRAHSRVQHTAHTGGARAAHADARATPTRTRAQHARVARQRSATHRAHFPSAAAGLPQSTPHTRARTLPTAGARIGRRREEPTGLKLTPQGTNEMPEGALGRRSLRHLDSSTS